ncbi:MAG TPA: hypothetical protein VHL11_06135, partial [Phototrophicaceae bacterium]|nr:hypothetical protein [Phototrophicaceae bacterium]
MSTLTRSVSQDDLLHLEAAGSADRQVEVEDGVIIDHHPISHSQPIIIENLYHPLEKFVREHHLGTIYMEGLRYQIKGTREHILRAYIPMLSYVKPGRLNSNFDPKMGFV